MVILINQIHIQRALVIFMLLNYWKE